MHRTGTDLWLGFQPSQTSSISVTLQLPWQLWQDLTTQRSCSPCLPDHTAQLLSLDRCLLPCGLSSASIGFLQGKYMNGHEQIVLYGHETTNASQPHANHLDSVRASALMSIA